MLHAHALGAHDPEGVRDRRAEHAHDHGGDPRLAVQLVAGAAELPERQREHEQRVAGGLGHRDGRGGDDLGQPLHRDRVRGVAEAGEQRRQQAEQRDLDALAEEVGDEDHGEAGEGEAERRPHDRLTRRLEEPGRRERHPHRHQEEHEHGDGDAGVAHGVEEQQQRERRHRRHEDEAPGGARAAPVGEHRAPQEHDAERQRRERHAQAEDDRLRRVGPRDQRRAAGHAEVRDDDDGVARAGRGAAERWTLQARRPCRRRPCRSQRRLQLRLAAPEHDDEHAGGRG